MQDSEKQPRRKGLTRSGKYGLFKLESRELFDKQGYLVTTVLMMQVETSTHKSELVALANEQPPGATFVIMEVY